MFRKLLKASFTALCAVLLAGSVCVFAQEETEIFVGEAYLETEGFYFGSVSDASLMSENNHEEGCRKILDGLKNADEVIYFDKDDFCFPIDESNYDEKGEFRPTQFLPFLYEVIDQHPEFFYIIKGHKGFGYVTRSDGTYYLRSVKPFYNMDKNDIPAAKKEFEELTNRIAQYAIGDNHSDFETAMLLHDYIILNYEYDTRADDPTVDPLIVIRDAYRFMTEGKGVCESYAKLYRYLLGLCGIESKYSSSDSMNHIWNLVKLDGKWYHADLTWDDPTPNRSGCVKYDYFLVGDEDFASSDIYGYSSTGKRLFHYDFYNEDDIVCEESYADAFWGHMAEENDSGFIFSDGAPIVFDKENYYYTSYNHNEYISAITARSKKNGNEKNVVEFEDNWTISGTTSFYVGNYSGLSLIDGVLIYNTPSEVRYVLPNGKHNTLIKRIQLKDSYFGDLNDGYIYYFGTSLDGKFREHEPFYTHIETPDSKNNSGWYGEGKDKYRIEINYFIASRPSENGIERDIDVHVDFDDIHHYENGKEAGKNESALKENFKKPTYITKGKKEKICAVCNAAVVIEEIPANCTQGENGHTPNINDITNIIKGILGQGSLSDDITNIDVDGDEQATLHDINDLFKLLREQCESEKAAE